MLFPNRLEMIRILLTVGMSVWCAAAYADGSAPRLVYSGMIGQVQPLDAEPVPWTACAWCVADARGDVHFPGGWRVRKGTAKPEKAVNEVSGRLFSDGAGELFYFDPQQAELGTVTADDAGLRPGRKIARLHHWDLMLHAAPHVCRKGYAARARFFALDRKRKEVHGWTEAGEDVGAVFAYADALNDYVSIAIHPASGDLLLGTGWPECLIHRFHPDGTEEQGMLWPAKGYALDLRNVKEETWVLGSEASSLSGSLTARARSAFGVFANRTYDIAWGGSGYFLATTQGAHYYAAAAPKHCAKRIGGLGNVTALAVHDGRVLVCDGHRMFNFWLDDRAGDMISSDHGWHVAKRWDECVDAIDVRDGIFYLREARHGRVVAFDPRVMEWVFRARRQYDVTNMVVKSDGRVAYLDAQHAVAIEPRGLVLYRQRVPERNVAELQVIPEAASHIAADGRWVVAYVPKRKALLRYEYVRNEE